MLLAGGGDPNLRTIDGSPLVVQIVKNDAADLLRVLLSHPDLEVNQPDPQGETALSWAVQLDKSSELKKTIKGMIEGMEIQNSDDGDQKTEIPKPDPLNEPPLEQEPAKDKGKEKETEQDKGKKKEGDAKKDATVLELLLEVPNHSKESLNRAFFNAMAKKDVHHLHILLLLGASVDGRGPLPGNKTSLMVAAETGDLSALHFLLDRGADWTLVDGQQLTPLELARGNGRSAIVDVLEQLREDMEM